jgi:TM2 domain-containing membrane protein YozV
MQRIIIILFCLINHNIFCQTALAEELLTLERDAYYSRSDTTKTQFYVAKFYCYLKHKVLDSSALKEVSRIDFEKIKDSIQQCRFLWNASLLAHINKRPQLAYHYFSEYMSLSNDVTDESNLLALSIFATLDSSLVYSHLTMLNKYDIHHLDSLYRCSNRVDAYSIKNKKKYTIASAIVPGLGSILNGNIIKGTSSFVICGTNAYITYLLFSSNLYFNSFVWAYAITAKFWFGNINLTNSLVERKESMHKNILAQNCKNLLSEKLKEHPLFFR